MDVNRDYNPYCRQPPWWGELGLLTFSFGLFALINDVPAINVLWYAFAWYGYLRCFASS